MNKIWLLLSVLVIALFVVSCAPKDKVGEEDVEVIEEVEEGGALAGQAISGTCNDPDSVSTYDVAQVFIKSTTIKGTGKWVDQCQTVNGKVILKEGICKNGKMATWQYSCSKQNKLPGDKFECVSGACVNKGVPTCTPQCAGKTCGDNGCGGICGECADDEECKDSQCVMLNAPAPTCTPEPTGSSKCVIKVFPNYNNNALIASIKEYQYANCSTYFGNNDGLNNNQNFSACGWNKDQTKLVGLCQDNKGCCNDEIPLKANYCEGNILTNTSKNVCTGEEKVNQLDCSTWVHIDGTPKICMQDSKGGFFCGVTSCTLGEKIVTCNNYNDYSEYTCLGAQFDKSLINPTWVPTNSMYKCPLNKTCQFFSGKNQGICN